MNTMERDIMQIYQMTEEEKRVCGYGKNNNRKEEATVSFRYHKIAKCVQVMSLFIYNPDKICLPQSQKWSYLCHIRCYLSGEGLQIGPRSFGGILKEIPCILMPLMFAAVKE